MKCGDELLRKEEIFHLIPELCADRDVQCDRMILTKETDAAQREDRADRHKIAPTGGETALDKLVILWTIGRWNS
jgi:hypothetical protein